MKIFFLTPGSGDNFYCENCMRDNSLARCLLDCGHDVSVIPLYLPVNFDNLSSNTSEIFFGGVNVYLQQKFSLFRKTPRWLDRVFDSRVLLDRVSKLAGMTSTESLGPTTIAMLQAEQGPQKKELDRLINWLVENELPDVICLSNALLIGMARELKARIDVPIVCLLQDEDEFVDALPESFAKQSWQLIADCGQYVDAFVTSSEAYASRMARQLAIPDAKLAIINPVLLYEDYKLATEVPDRPVIGYISRLCADKGLDILVDCFIALKDKHENLRLKIAGGMTNEDKPFVKANIQKLSASEYMDDVEFTPTFQRNERFDFFSSISVLAVSEKREPSYGMYALEALASGVAVLLPDHDIFRQYQKDLGEVIQLYDRKDQGQLQDKLAFMLSDPGQMSQLGRAGRQKLMEVYQPAATAGQLLAVFDRIMRDY
ncbi:MAG: glycosyltransferase family 4 protein [Phycisphaerae bacterium]|nr:glycosyltransferase family 4 protein [Phycisphaerae bacterium]